jgi:hypothetical protein
VPTSMKKRIVLMENNARLSTEQPAPPAGAREFYRTGYKSVVSTIEETFEFAEAYAAQERARADAAEREVENLKRRLNTLLNG